MKTLSFSRKIRLGLAILVLTILCSLNLIGQTTITSTSSGGLWNTATTWVGGVVPLTSQNVVISGPVYLNGDYVCNDLTVNAAGSLFNEHAYRPTITVIGKLTNNGKISTNPSGYELFLKLMSNIENNGVWTPTRTTFAGSNDQNIKQAAGKKFNGYFLTNDSIGQIVLGSHVTFESNTWDWSNSIMLTNGYQFTAINYQLNNGRFVSNDQINLRNTGIASMTFTGNYKIAGLVRIQDGIILNGTATVIDTLWNQHAHRPTIIVNAKIINNGKIMTNPQGYEIFLNIFNDIENNGIWAPNGTTFSATKDQNIKQSAETSFKGYFLTTDSIGQIVLASNVTFNSNTWDWSKSKLRTNGFDFTALNCQLNNGTIISDDKLILQNTGIASMTFTGNYEIDGNVRIQDGITFNGTVTVLDTLLNNHAFRPNIIVNAKIINKGAIIKNPAGYDLYLTIMSDIENNGIWAPNQTTLSSKNDQHIKQSAGKNFQGYFLTSDSIGDIILDSDVLFLNNSWQMNRSLIKTNKFNLNSKDYLFGNGKILSEATLSFKNSRLESMSLDGNYKIGGRVYFQDGNVFNGTATVLDTLYNQHAYRPTVTVNGKIINNGLITNNPSGYEINMKIMNDIENNGIWYPYRTFLAGKNDQTLKQSEGKSFQGYFLTTDSIGDIILDSDVMFLNNSWQMNRSLIKTNKFNLNSKDYLFGNGKILSEATLSLKNSRLESMSLDGNYKIGGRVYFQDGNVFNGTATVLDTLYNQHAYRPTVTVNGKIINNGLITNNPSGYEINMKIMNDIENNGIWYPYRTFLAGKNDQTLKQSEGKSFQGYFQTTDTLGQIVLGTDVTFDGSTWDWSKSELRTNGFKLTARNALLNSGYIISNDQLHFSNTRIADMNLNGNYKLSGKVRILNSNVFNGTATVVDTLLNENGYRPTITANGKLINNGTIINNPSGYEIFLNVFGDIENNGIWAPNRTTFSANTNQKIKQSAGKSFQGYFLSNDSIGDIVLASDILLNENTWDLNKCQIQTDSFKLMSSNYLLRGGKVLSNDTLLLRNSRLGDMKFNGDCKIGGLVRLLDGNIFSGTVTVLDTVYNEYGYRPSMTVQGKLVNNGNISNHPSGYNLHISISGNLENNKNINITWLYLNGTNDRTIGGRNAAGIIATVYADNAVSLVGDNVLPNLNFTNNPQASCTIKKGASLTLIALPSTTKLKNFGRISVAQDVDNIVDNTYNYYAASVRTKAKTLIGKLAIDNYGNQQHPTATGTINTWWRLRNAPQLFNDSLIWLKLSYLDETLNGIIEDSIKVFHSPNSGMSWKRIKKGYTIDNANNTVTINNAPSFGHYLLSNSALGITSFQPLVESAEPRFGGNTGQLTMYLFGAGFKSTSTVKLKLTGQSDILSEATYLTDVLGESMLAQFDLKYKEVGVYDVIIETPGQKTQTLPAYFTVMPGERSNPWAILSGRDRFLINRWQTFNIGFGNTANTDARGTILAFAINDLPGLEVEFPDIKLVLPKSVLALNPIYAQIPDYTPIFYVTNTLTGYEGQSMRVYPFYVPTIAAGTANTARVKVKLNGAGTLKMDAWILDPLYEKIDDRLKKSDPEIPMEVRACISFHAVKYAGQQLTGGLPVLSCLPLLDKLYPPENYMPDSMVPEEKTYTWGSFAWDFVSAGLSIGQCATGFFPGPGTALSYGLSVVGGLMDLKENSEINAACWAKFKKLSQNKLGSRGVTSFDPNEKVGPQGYTSEHYISKEGNLNYTIFFENKKTAGASALEVFVKDTLDITKFDFKTFSFSSVTFGETTAKIQEYAKEFQILVDLYPKKNIIVQVHGELDTIKGIISWEFHSLDRITMELTEDPDMGFLPPNVTGTEGEGNVTYSCKLKETVVHDDIISNRASIVFDFNAPILTNMYTNRIDDRLPVSKVAPIHHVQYDSIFYVSWSGSDLGSKISKYNIFVSTNNNDFVLWKVASTPGEAEFTGKHGVTYRFYSLATDSVGFTETRKTTPEATTTMDVVVGADQINASRDVVQVFPNPAEQQCNVTFNFPALSETSISLEDISGKRIRTIEKQKYQPGKRTVVMNLIGISNGLYFVKVVNNNKAYYQKLVIKN